MFESCTVESAHFASTLGVEGGLTAGKDRQILLHPSETRDTLVLHVAVPLQAVLAEAGAKRVEQPPVRLRPVPRSYVPSPCSSEGEQILCKFQVGSSNLSGGSTDTNPLHFSTSTEEIEHGPTTPLSRRRTPDSPGSNWSYIPNRRIHSCLRMGDLALEVGMKFKYYIDVYPYSSYAQYPPVILPIQNMTTPPGDEGKRYVVEIEVPDFEADLPLAVVSAKSWSTETI